MDETGSRLSHLECRSCCAQVEADRPVGTCPTCGHALFAAYRTEGFDGPGWMRQVATRRADLWRYRELLPVRRTNHIASLGEGFSPVVSLAPGAGDVDLDLRVKDDGGLPTGSFKARGMAAAVSRAHELGLRSLFVPSAGNAGVALAAYGARAGLPVRVYLPERTPQPMKDACRLYGADVVELPGTLREVGAAAREREAHTGAFDLSTLREPYRLEGKKTMGFEIFEQSQDDSSPDAVVYPTGGGTGLVGMYKAFEELQSLGLADRVPRLYAVQPSGCAPVVRALREDAAHVTPWENPATIAPGLLVPAPFASERILEAVRATRGGGTTVTDAEIVAGIRDLGRLGISASPEGAATYAALPGLIRDRQLRSGERVLLYNTGSGLPFSLPELERSVATSPSV